jgi:hypothetical protein
MDLIRAALHEYPMTGWYLAGATILIWCLYEIKQKIRG